MKFIIIGSGIVGLSIAKSIIEKKICNPEKILIVDKYSIPSKGTSIRNSGVLHAGLYYEPESLKAKLSIQGGKKLIMKGDEVTDTGKAIENLKGGSKIDDTAGISSQIDEVSSVKYTS